jgi:DNA-binding CsgD family transcriptional regulator
MRARMIALSEREREVLELFDQGKSYKEIATVLGISVHTVKAYGERIIIKTVATSLRNAAWRRRQPLTEKPASPKKRKGHGRRATE